MIKTSSLIFPAILTLLMCFPRLAYEQTTAKPSMILDEVFALPHKIIVGNQVTYGIDKVFIIPKRATVGLRIAGNKKRPHLNVNLLDEEQYTKYRSSFSLKHIRVNDEFSKQGTSDFEAIHELAPGKYFFLIRWADQVTKRTQLNVALKVYAREIQPSGATLDTQWADLLGDYSPTPITQ